MGSYIPMKYRIHNIPFNFNPFGLENKDHTGEPDIFWVTKEPFGIIQATVVQPKEKHLYPNYPIVVLTDNDIGITATRKWIYEYAKDYL